ncbi:MAG TPA: TldD/PmbA family protein [Bacteroidota bacterium]|nr:TldD/PmbA family protein [Bacteroidota bacterium]
MNIQDFGLDETILLRLLSIALSQGGDFADIYFQYGTSLSIKMEEDIIKNTSTSILLGVGIRVIDGIQTGYAYTSDLSNEKLVDTARNAAIIAKNQHNISPKFLQLKNKSKNIYDLQSPVIKAEISEQINLVRDAYNSAKKYDNRITKITSSLASSYDFITIANSEGLLISDERPQTRLMVAATAEDGQNKTTAIANNGGRAGMEFYKSVETPESIGKRASQEAIILLSARNAPSGELPVVLGSEESGVMIHEAVGHPLEADGIWQKTSVMWNKFGEVVANPNVSIYDDPTIPNYRGSLNIDDEGCDTENIMLIEKGKIVGFMNDYLSSKLLKHKRNGHGRRESFQSIPIPRMSNTVLMQGEYSPQEIIESTKYGIYAKSFQGGMVEGTGKFTFSLNLGYLIENGKLTAPIKNVTLIGMNLDILKNIEMVGNDMGFFLGTCGKQGQSVSVTSGTPTLKISKMTVGGINGIN